MSRIAEYFENVQESGKVTDVIMSDDFFGMFREVNGLKNRLSQIRRDQLACCGARLGSKGAAELLVIDRPVFDALDEEFVATEGRIKENDEYLSRFDSIADEAEKLGLECAPTPYGLEHVRVETSNAHFKAQRKIDATTKNLIDRRIPAGEVGAHPQIVELEIAMTERQKRLEAIEGLLAKAKELEVPA